LTVIELAIMNTDHGRRHTEQSTDTAHGHQLQSMTRQKELTLWQKNLVTFLAT